MFVWSGLRLVRKMNELQELIKDRDRTVDEISELISMRDSVHCDIADLRDRLQELNDDIEATKDEIAKDAKKEEDEFFEILKSDDYSTLAREYRRLNTKIYEGRMRGWYTFMENISYPSEGEVRQHRRDVGDRMHEVELREYELNEKQRN